MKSRIQVSLVKCNPVRLLVLVLACSASDIFAGINAASGATPPQGKKVVGLAPVSTVQIQMPDQTIHDFGQDYQASMTNQLTQSGKYIVSSPLQAPESGPASSLISDKLAQNPAQYVWNGSSTPVATVKVDVEALDFSSDSKGDRMFYGFDERFDTPFNNGGPGIQNEFPLRLFNPDEPSWFGNTFQQKGVVPMDSRSGLDLGDGFEIDALMVWMNVKYASYRSELHLQLELDSPVGAMPQIHETRMVNVQGSGFYFDVVGGYEGYSAGITLARTDAMSKALKSAIDGSYSALDRALASFPLMARIDGILEDGTILLGTGLNSGILAGIQYQLATGASAEAGEGVIVQVTSSVPSGSIGKVVSGSLASLRAGQLLQQVTAVASMHVAESSNTAPAVVDSTQLPPTNIPQINLNGWVPTITQLEAFAISLEKSIFLPYRIWRYFMYDQSFHKTADLQPVGVSYSTPWSLKGESWAAKVGLASSNTSQEVSPAVAPVVAIIDSGIDYNHPVTHDSLWTNSNPWKDPQGRQDHYGWDFISEDSHPFDDGYHGTQVASVVLGVMPQAKLMPLKIFNPWGVTSSGAIDAAFTYAVDHGAQIIVCAWATNVDSKAIEAGVAYAHDHGVSVVAAAGDLGMNMTQTQYYPAVLSEKYDNVLTVTGVDAQDHLLNTIQRIANYDPNSVLLAAPSQDIPVAEPRSQYTKDTSTGLAAAMVAGALARYQGADVSYQQGIAQLLQDADLVPGLMPYVRSGLRLHIRR